VAMKSETFPEVFGYQGDVTATKYVKLKQQQ